MAEGLGVSDRLFNSFGDLPAGAVANYERGVKSGKVKMTRDEALDYANRNPLSVVPRNLRAHQPYLTSVGWDANRVASHYASDPMSTVPADMRARYQREVAAGRTNYTPEQAARYYWQNYANKPVTAQPVTRTPAQPFTTPVVQPGKSYADSVVEQAEQKAQTAVGPLSASYSADTRALSADADLLSERNARAQQQISGWQANEAMRNSDPGFANLSDAYMRQWYNSPADARAQAILDRRRADPNRPPYTAEELGGVPYEDHFERYSRNMNAKPDEPLTRMVDGKLVSTGKTRAQTIYDNTLSRGDTMAKRMNSDFSNPTPMQPVDLRSVLAEGGIDPVSNPKEFEARMDKIATEYNIYRKGMGADARLDYPTFIDISLNPEHYGRSDIEELGAGKQRIQDERTQLKSEKMARNNEWRQNAFEQGQFQQYGALPAPGQPGGAGSFFPQQAANGAAFNPQALQSIAQQVMPGLTPQQTQALVTQLVPLVIQQMNNQSALFLQ